MPISASTGQRMHRRISRHAKTVMWRPRRWASTPGFRCRAPFSDIALENERNEVDILRRRMDASVLLIKALGGRWDVSKHPQIGSMH
jgi:hypothetical protein